MGADGRATASASWQTASDSSKRHASRKPPPSRESTSARSADGGCAGTSSTACSLRGKARVVLAAFVQVAGKTRVQECGASAIALADELDRPPLKLDCARCRPRAAGQLRGPGTELGELQPHELGRVRHDIPERERPLEVRASLRQTEHGLRLPCGFDRGDERLRVATRGRPVGRELRRAGVSAARKHVGKPRVQLLALAGQDRRVDRLRQQRMAETEACPSPGSATRTPCSTAWRSDSRRSCSGTLRGRLEQRVADVASGCRRHAQHALRRLVETDDALQEEVAQAAGKLPAPVACGGEELLGEERVALRAGHDRVRHRRRQGSVGVTREERCELVALERLRARERAPSRSAELPFASLRMRSADGGSSAR